MPRLARHPCRRFGCKRLVPAHQGYCDIHRPVLHREIDAARPSASARGYDRAWRQKREAFLREHPRCATCGEPATQVDHVVPLSGGGEDHPENYASRCASHHSRKTAQETGFRRRWWKGKKRA